ncbi:hypothetical protein NEHOM01_0849 [Nematocida homosporus]|uniref:uncharacterized protein n=1 Tax=Nematocida homosporus TaxID=1912981 RepID=UPI00222012E7|nr:uncharacterized protein NEHOM01_0849 [Nematocida homosporus]KAI5185490.1 hypothetical protein NEHOM01_0849 [Nematocida homosporus]
MNKRLRSPLDNLILSLLFILSLFKISYQTVNSDDQQVQLPLHSSFILPNGLKGLVINQPESSITHVSIAIRKHLHATSAQNKGLSCFLNVALKYKLDPNNHNDAEFKEFLAQPNIYKTTDMGNFLIIEFFAKKSQSLIPLKLLTSVIVTPPTLEEASQINDTYLAKHHPTPPTPGVIENKIIALWNSIFCLSTIRLAIATPCQPVEIVDLLTNEYKDLDQTSEPKMYIPSKTKVLKDLLSTRRDNTPTQSESTTITLFIPLLNDIKNKTRQPIIDLLHLLTCCNKIYDGFLQYSGNIWAQLKEIPRITLKLIPSVYLVIEIDNKDRVDPSEALDLVDGFFQAIKATYKQSYSKIGWCHKTIINSTRLAPMKMELPCIPNLVSVYLFFADVHDIIKFIYTPISHSQKICNIDDLLEMAMKRELWIVRRDAPNSHQGVLANQASGRSYVQPVPKATLRVGRIKNIICLCNTESMPQQTNNTALGNHQSSSSNLNPIFSSQNSASRANRPFQVASARAYPTSSNNIALAQATANNITHSKYEEPGLEAHSFIENNHEGHSTVSIVLTNRSYLSTIHSYIWQVTHVLAVLEEANVQYLSLIGVSDVLIEAEVKEDGKFVVVLRGSAPDIKHMVQMFFSLYKYHQITLKRLKIAVHRTTNFFLTEFYRRGSTRPNPLFAEVWNCLGRTPLDCYQYIRKIGINYATPLIEDALINIRAENVPQDLFHAIIKLVKAYIKPWVYTNYQLIGNHSTQHHSGKKSEEISALIGYFQIDPMAKLGVTNYHMLAYYLLLKQFPPSDLTNQDVVKAVQDWEGSLAPASTSAAPIPESPILSFDQRIIENLESAITFFDDTIVLTLTLNGRYSPARLLHATTAYSQYLTWVAATMTSAQLAVCKERALHEFDILMKTGGIFEDRPLLFQCNDFWREFDYKRKFADVLNKMALDKVREFILYHCMKPLTVIHKRPRPLSLDQPNPPQPKTAQRRAVTDPLDDLDPSCSVKRLNLNS